MGDTSFRRKRLQFMIAFEKEDFGDKQNTVVLEGYRASVTIDVAGVDLGNHSWPAAYGAFLSRSRI